MLAQPSPLPGACVSPHKPLTSCPDLSCHPKSWLVFLPLQSPELLRGRGRARFSVHRTKPQCKLEQNPCLPSGCSLKINHHLQAMHKKIIIIIHGECKKWVLFLTHRRSEWLLATRSLDHFCQIYIYTHIYICPSSLLMQTRTVNWFCSHQTTWPFNSTSLGGGKATEILGLHTKEVALLLKNHSVNIFLP